MITIIKNLLAQKRAPEPLTVAEAVSQYKAAQFSNDIQARKAARDALDRAYGAIAECRRFASEGSADMAE